MKTKSPSDLHKKLIELGKIALDSNVFVYLLEKNEDYFPQVETIFQLLEQGKIECISSVLSLLEVVSTPNLLSKPDVIKKYESFFKKQSGLHIYDVDSEIIMVAGEIRRCSKIHSPDAIQLATASIKQAKLFVTNDQHFKSTTLDSALPEIYFLS